MKDDSLAIPAAFVIDSSGALRWEFVGDKPPDLPTIEHLLRVLHDMKRTSDQTSAEGASSVPTLRPVYPATR